MVSGVRPSTLSDNELGAGSGGTGRECRGVWRAALGDAMRRAPGSLHPGHLSCLIRVDVSGPYVRPLDADRLTSVIAVWLAAGEFLIHRTTPILIVVGAVPLSVTCGPDSLHLLGAVASNPGRSRRQVETAQHRNDQQPILQARSAGRILVARHTHVSPERSVCP